MDQINREILTILQDQGRISMTELGKKVSLSVSVVTERVRQMEDEGIISKHFLEQETERENFIYQDLIIKTSKVLSINKSAIPSTLLTVLYKRYNDDPKIFIDNLIDHLPLEENEEITNDLEDFLENVYQKNPSYSNDFIIVNNIKIYIPAFLDDEELYVYENEPDVILEIATHYKAKCTSSYQLNYLEDFIGEVEDALLEDNHSNSQLEILEKFKYGRFSNPEPTLAPSEKVDNSWKLKVPKILSEHIPNYKKMSLSEFYHTAKSFKSLNPNLILPYLAELSEKVFEAEEVEEDTLKDQVEGNEFEDSILSLVEMIILPHLEVIEIMKAKNGKVLFADIWNVPFNEKLKTKVKDRDNWMCVICEKETDLHVHHKIPRDKGGIHHLNNLVTLCASCHGAVETANVQSAFITCLRNYKVNRYKLKMAKTTWNKKLLREEIELSLNTLLDKATRADDAVQIDEILGVITKLEILLDD